MDTHDNSFSWQNLPFAFEASQSSSYEQYFKKDWYHHSNTENIRWGWLCPVWFGFISSFGHIQMHILNKNHLQSYKYMKVLTQQAEKKPIHLHSKELFNMIGKISTQWMNGNAVILIQIQFHWGWHSSDSPAKYSDFIKCYQSLSCLIRHWQKWSLLNIKGYKQILSFTQRHISRKKKVFLKNLFPQNSCQVVWQINSTNWQLLMSVLFTTSSQSRFRILWILARSRIISH